MLIALTIDVENLSRLPGTCYLQAVNKTLILVYVLRLTYHTHLKGILTEVGFLQSIIVCVHVF